MDTPIGTIRPEIQALIELGNGSGGIRVSSHDRAGTKDKILQALAVSKKRFAKRSQTDQ